MCVCCSRLIQTVVWVGMHRDWVFDGVTVAHTGGYGIWINKAAFNTVVQYSHVYDVGAGAVRVGPPQSGVEVMRRGAADDVACG